MIVTVALPARDLAAARFRCVVIKMTRLAREIPPSKMAAASFFAAAVGQATNGLPLTDIYLPPSV